MVIEATQLEKDHSQMNNDAFKDDIEWLEKGIDFAIEKNTDILFANRNVRISHEIKVNEIRWDVVFDRDDRDPVGSLTRRIICRSNFSKAFEILEKKYKEYGWKISFSRYPGDPFHLKCIFVKKCAIENNIEKSKSFWKSLFSKRKRIEKDYSVLEEMEKKYS